jgi:hypothetical protein
VTFDPPFPPPPPEPPPPPPPEPEPPRLPEPEAIEDGPAWERRSRIGWLSALIETCTEVLLTPSRFFATMPATGGAGGPLLFAVIVGLVGFAAATLYNTIFNSLVGASFERLSQSPGLEKLAPFLQGRPSLLFQAVVGPILLFVGLFLSSGLFHLFLLLYGSGRQGFEATFRVVCYAQAVNLLGVIPFCGGLIALPYLFVLYVIGLASVHSSGEGQAYAAIVTAALFVCCCVFGAVLALGGLGLMAGLGAVS